MELAPATAAQKFILSGSPISENIGTMTIALWEADFSVKFEDDVHCNIELKGHTGTTQNFANFPVHDKESFESKNLDIGSNHDSSLGAKVITNVVGENVLCATNNGGSSLFHWMVVLYEQGD